MELERPCLSHNNAQNTRVWEAERPWLREESCAELERLGPAVTKPRWSLENFPSPRAACDACSLFQKHTGLGSKSHCPGWGRVTQAVLSPWDWRGEGWETWKM